MKKIVLLLISVLIVSGCSANYEIEIGDKTTELLQISPDLNNKEEINYLSNYKNKDEFYNFTSNNREYYYDFNANDNLASLKFNYNEILGLNLSAIIRNCFQTRSIVTEEDVYSFNLSDFTCNSYNYFNVSSFNIKVIIADNYNVITSNADAVNGNILVWNNNDNFNEIVLKIQRNKDEIDNPTKEEDDHDQKISQISQKENKSVDSKSIMICIFGSITFMMLIIGYFIYQKYK